MVSSTARSSDWVYLPPPASLTSLSTRSSSRSEDTLWPRSNESSYTNLMSGVSRSDTLFPMLRRTYPSIFFNPLMAFFFPRSSPRMETNTFTTWRSPETSTSATVTMQDMTLSTPIRSSGYTISRNFCESEGWFRLVRLGSMRHERIGFRVCLGRRMPPSE